MSKIDQPERIQDTPFYLFFRALNNQESTRKPAMGVGRKDTSRVTLNVRPGPMMYGRGRRIHSKERPKMVEREKQKRGKVKAKGEVVPPQAIVSETSALEMTKAKLLASTSSREMATANGGTTVVTVMVMASKEEKGRVHLR